MHTKVVYQSAKALTPDRLRRAALQFPRRRPQRRRVGRRRGEKDDFRAALDYMAQRVSGRRLWAAGFSFGSYIAHDRRRRRRPRSARLIAIAPPVDNYDFAAVIALARKPKFIVHGEQDELIPLKAVREFYAQLQDPKELVEIDRANHLFEGQTGEVGDALEDLLAGFLMHDAVIVSATARPSARRRRHAPDRAARRDGGHRHRRGAAPRAGPRPGGDRRRDHRLRHARSGAGAQRGAHRQPARRHAGRRRRPSPSTASARRGCRPSPSPPSGSCAASRDAVVAGGTESMSLVPMGGNKVSPNPALVDQLPRRVPEAPVSWPKTTRAKHASRARSRTPSRCAATSGRWPRSTRADSTTRSCR